MNTSSGTFSADTSDILRMAEQFAGGQKVAQRELLRGMRLATADTYTNIKAITPHGKGNLQASLETKVTQGNALGSRTAGGLSGGITGMVLVRKARSNYAWWVNYGRGPIRPKNKKWLRFRGSDGNFVFTKYVKPKAGVFFMERGLAASAGDINRAIDGAVDRIIRYLGTSR